VNAAAEQAAAAVATAVAERDTIQANLLDLDGSFGKRMLAGARLAGQTRQRWDAATAGLTRLWEIFTAYSAIVDRAAETLASTRRPPGPKIAEIVSLLYGKSVRLTPASSALARGDLTGRGDTFVTPPAAVQDMKRAFASVAEVITAAEAVWNAVAEPLQQVAAELTTARQQAGLLAGPERADQKLTEALALAETDLGQLRDVLNSDPLALWHGGQVDVTRLTRLRERAAAAAFRAGELGGLREHADQRIATVTEAVAAARSAWEDARAARERAAVKIAAVALPTLPEAGGLADRLTGLAALQAAGRWTRLAAELDRLEDQAAQTARDCRDAERAAAALLEQRDELRGLLNAYQAKAARLGAAEDRDLDARYDRARDLLWTAPCDLSAAAEAVTGYQRAVLALSGQEQRT
jgi:hypothetical protein